MESKHILSSFDDELNKLNNNLLKLGNGALAWPGTVGTPSP